MLLWASITFLHQECHNYALGGVRPIAVGETLYSLIGRALCFQFHEALVTHFSPHQFGVVTKGGYEVVTHDIICILDLHPNCVVLQLNVANAFNLVSKGVIFQELRATSGDIIQFILFVCVFYAFEFFLFYSHYNCEGDVIIIPFAMGTRQGDLRGGDYLL